MVPSLSTAQLFTVFCCGLATVDAGMFPIYQNIGVRIPHFISFSIIAVFEKYLTSRTEMELFRKCQASLPDITGQAS